MRNLENYDTLELNAKEIKEINGGIFGWDDMLVGLAIAAGVAIINDWDNFNKGFWSAFK